MLQNDLIARLTVFQNAWNMKRTVAENGIEAELNYADSASKLIDRIIAEHTQEREITNHLYQVVTLSESLKHLDSYSSSLTNALKNVNNQKLKRKERLYTCDWILDKLEEGQRLIDELAKRIREKRKQIEQEPYTPEYTLLVSNVGWVVSESDPRRFDYSVVKKLFEEYVASGNYEQVSMWSDQENDPVQEYGLTKGQEENSYAD